MTRWATRTLSRNRPVRSTGSGQWGREARRQHAEWRYKIRLMALNTVRECRQPDGAGAAPVRRPTFGSWIVMESQVVRFA